MKKLLSILVIIASFLVLSSCGRHIAQLKQKPQQLTQQPTTYLCPMHTDYISSVPGKCPKCGMQLVSFDDYRNSKSGTTNQNRMPDSHTGVGGSGGGHSGHH
jgi:nitrous oxide reductase accessory protein NosL